MENFNSTIFLKLDLPDIQRISIGFVNDANYDAYVGPIALLDKLNEIALIGNPDLEEDM